MRIGVFGGTFDPPHIAHLILADESCFQLDLDKILWVLTPVSPLKPDVQITPWVQRLELLEAAISDNPKFVISRVDIDRAAPSYTYETLRILNKGHPNDEIIFLMGGDSLRDFPRWEKPGELISYCEEIGVMERPGAETNMKKLGQMIPGLRDKIRWIEAPLLEISSRRIRKKIELGEPFKYYLKDEVYNLINSKSLYISVD